MLPQTPLHTIWGNPPRLVLAAAALVAGCFVSASLGETDESTFPAAREVLEGRCLKCHGQAKQKGGLSLASRDGVLAGGHSGAAAVAGDASKSLMISAISYTDPDLEMPPTGQISSREIETLTGWIDAGLPWPTGVTLQSDAEEIAPSLQPLWCDLPPQRPAVPRVESGKSPPSPIDAFILSRLEDAQLRPAPPTDRTTLIRRLTYDLTGLPPTPAEVTAFVETEEPDAYSKLVDRLLASPQYGVKWGRHWLDLVRFAETDGYERDRLKPGAWRYRDWVIDAFNADLPYDRFLIDQIAGDELSDAGPAEIIATGFHRLGIWDDEPANTLQAVYDDLDGVLDTTCRVTMAMSIGCARCHDHKGDPISIVDYARMLAFFEGLLPYKVGGGNAPTPKNYLRAVPVDLGSDAFEKEMLSFLDERKKRSAEVASLVGEVRTRWGANVLAEADRSLASGLVRHETFDGASSQGGGDLELAGTTWAAGRLGEALQIQGSESGGSIPRPVSNDFTISFWFRADQPGAGGGHEDAPKDLRWFRGSGLVDGEVPGIVADYGISLVGDHLCAGVGAPETFLQGPAGGAEGQWHHAACTRRKSDGTVELWFDGSKVDSARGGTQDLTAPPILRIGRMQPGYNSLVGSIDDLRIYDRTLEPVEILDLALLGGALPTYTSAIRDRLGPPEAGRHQKAVERLLELSPPIRETIEVLCAKEKGPEIAPSFVRLRGIAAAKGEEVLPGFPQILGGGEPAITPTTQGTSGRRLAFARWLTQPEHPRFARVMVNRIWQHHFGSGIVPTPSDFGAFGEAPSHPELLDWLAVEFRERGYRLKEMHRLIVYSDAYQRSSIPDRAALERDPNNRLYSYFNPRRLSAEELRDSVLAVSGVLNLEQGGPGIYPPLPKEVLATASRPGQAWGNSSPEQASRRSIYIHAKRSLLHPLLEGFDLAPTDTSCPVRFVTTQPTQALMLFNSAFSQEQSKLFATRLQQEYPGDRRAQVERGLALARQRSVPLPMLERQLSFIENLSVEQGLSERRALELFCLFLINLNEFVTID